MRLRQHITEDIQDSEEFLSKFYKKLDNEVNTRFTKELKTLFHRPHHFLIRGMRTTRDNWITKDVRQDRKPSDSSQEWHDFMNKQFMEEFGIDVRSKSVFCSLKYVGYGNPYIIFPIDDYYFIYSNKVRDLYQYDGDMEAYLIKTYNKTNSFVDLRNEINIDNVPEIMMVCKKYLAIRRDKFEVYVDKWLIDKWTNNK